MSTRAVLIAGTHSGSGKTTVTLGLMAALRRMGRTVMPFKCGPDFIDPSLHRLVTGAVSRNLDIWMAGEDFCRDCFARFAAAAEISVVEGVMGMFDGRSSSSAELAKKLGIPIILVLDVRSAAESGAAVLKGFETLDPEAAPAAVILNRVGSARHYQLVKEAIEAHCRAEVLGCLPRTLDFAIPSRHLGLHMGEESPLEAESIEALAASISEHIDLDRLLEIAAIHQPEGVAEHRPATARQVRLAVARDKAFCFYYEDNLDLFRRAGAELVFFSPLDDRRLPENIAGIYLGGGYPELYGERLSANGELLAALRAFCRDGGPVYAECGGFMYLSEGITDLEGAFHPLAGIFPTRTVMQKSRAQLGYREVTTRAASFFGPAGSVLRGHEFHYSRAEEVDDSVERLYDLDNGGREGYRLGNVLGGYMHLHFGRTPGAAENFIDFCSQQPRMQPCQ